MNDSIRPQVMIVALLILFGSGLFLPPMLPAQSGVMPSPRILGYYPSWKQTDYPCSAIPYTDLTHIAHAFAWPADDGAMLYPENIIYPDLITSAHQHGVKVVLALGGWGHSDGFGPMTASAETRTRFISELSNFVRQYHYDGVDIDWEFPTASDSAHLVEFVAALDSALNRLDSTLTLSAALPWFDPRGGFSVSSLRSHLDWVGLMTYDFHGSWSAHSGYNAPLYPAPPDSCGSTDQSVKYWLHKGFPAGRISVGIPFFGRLFHTRGIYQPHHGGNAISFVDITTLISQGWKVYRDPVAMVPALQDSLQSQWISYEDTTSIRVKAQYIRTHKLHGVIIWALGHDAFPDNTQPLLRQTAVYLRRPE